MPKPASVRRYVHWEKRLLHINARRLGVPESTLAWTEEYFGKSPAVQKLLGLNNSLKPEVETAAAVVDRLKARGLMIRNPKRPR